MSFQTPTLNGTAVNPSNIEPKITKVGSQRRAANGAAITVIRGTKREWTLTWADVPWTTVSTIETIAALNTTYTFVDEQGRSYTVVNKLEAFSTTVSGFIGGIQPLYTVTLDLLEA